MRTLERCCHVLFKRQLRSICSPQETRGHRSQERLRCGHGPRGALRGVLSRSRRPDAGQEHPHLRERQRARRRMRRPRHSGPRLRHARRPRNGQPLRGDVGPLPLHPLHRDPRCFRFGRVLLAQQGRPQLLALPRNEEPRARRGVRREVRSLGQGGHGDHGALLHARREALRSSHHRLL